ncbi:MAG: HAMP domain-containing sensor histidine kinase [bacterium]|nr:HAMP domain-containing sensor histidine kinase [bacterium]
MGRIRKSNTLGGIFMRYVLVMLGALVAIGVGAILIFNIFINIGWIYPANYAESKINEAYDLIRSAHEVTEDMIPPLCRYVIFSEDGEILSGNMPKQSTRIAWDVASQKKASGNFFYKAISREKEYVVLQYSLTPQYQSAFLREHFIEPQRLMSILVILGGMAMIVLLSVRFGKKIKRNMQPLMVAVENIKNQDLEYEVSYSGIKELDECLSSIDDMRMALKASLEQQWKLEQDKNRQMSALAHDIKTPLTIVRGNAELLAETALTEEQKSNVDYVISSAVRIQDYVQKLIELTKSVAGCQHLTEKVVTEALMNDIRKQASGLAGVYSLKLNWNEQWNSKTIHVAYDQVVRAVMNIVQNAAEHTGKEGTIDVSVVEENGAITFSVEDTGSGFSKEALLHGTEQFFMDDTSRSGEEHYGIGLFFAKTVAEKHGGKIMLANSKETGGARVDICFHRNNDEV